MIGIGLIGCGYWGPNVARVFDSMDDCELRAACDRDSRRLKSIRSGSSAFRTSTDARDLIDAKDVDAIAICTPVASHYRLAHDALLAGKHVFLEKPMTDSLETARALVELAERHKLVLHVDHTFVYSGAVRKIRSIIESGSIGDLLYFDSVRINLGLFQPDVNVVWDLAAHDVSILLHLVDLKPRWVSAIGVKHYGNHESQAYVTILFEEAFLAHIHVNWLAPVKLRSTLIGGSQSMIVYDDLEPSEKVRVYEKGVTFNEGGAATREEVLVDYRVGDMLSPHIDKTESLERSARTFVDAIAGAGGTESGGDAGMAVVRILEAAHRSMQCDGGKIALGDTF